jgi:Xaa-Pro dipeptidase
MRTEVLGDRAVLREARRRRLYEAMDAHRIDALLLGHEANTRYASGAERLWTAGTRPYGPGCVVVRPDEAIHLVSTWDEGIPEDIPHENLFGITWNPGNLLGWLQGIKGLTEASRIGTDSLTPRFAALYSKMFPSAELVDAEPMLQGVRRTKTEEEVDAIRVAVHVAERALAVALANLRPGATERCLTACFMEAMARLGVTTPATQRVVWISSQGRPTEGERKIEESDLVTFDAGVMAGGYSGEVGRTWVVGSPQMGVTELYNRADDLWLHLLSCCQPGRHASDLLDAYAAAGERLPPSPIACGLGLGFDLPVVVRALPRTAKQERFDPGMVLSVTARVSDGTRTVSRKEAVLVTADGPAVLTSFPHWNRQQSSTSDDSDLDGAERDD